MASVSNISSDSNKEMAYDLRQIYAALVGEHLNDIAEARRSDNYNAYLKNLEDLHTIIRHKFKDKKKEEDTYKLLVQGVSTLANTPEHSSTWVNKTKNPKSAAIIEGKLREIEMFLYEKMEEANMFGQKYSDDDDDL